MFPPILVSCDWCDKLSQTMWLKTTEIYSFTVLVARGPNPGVIRVVLPPEAIEELLFLVSSSF